MVKPRCEISLTVVASLESAITYYDSFFLRLVRFGGGMLLEVVSTELRLV